MLQRNYQDKQLQYLATEMIQDDKSHLQSLRGNERVFAPASQNHDILKEEWDTDSCNQGRNTCRITERATRTNNNP